MRRPWTGRGSRAGNHFVAIVVVLAIAGAVAAAGSGLEDTPEPTRPDAGSQVQRQAGRTGDALTVAWSEPPGSLDPAYVGDRTAATLTWNLFDPLVRLGPRHEPVASLAAGWRVDRGGRRYTFTLRPGARWTNGDSVTAHDFEYAWKRVLSPGVDSPHASRLFALRGAAAYHSCSGLAECARLRGRVGVRAASGEELVVTLDEPRPWFPTETAHAAFLPVHRSTVEGFGREWTDPANIVTNGPFSLAQLDADSVVLVKNRDWHGASRVALGRVAGRFVPDARARVQAFDAGVVMALDGAGLPGADVPALRERREYQTYPASGAHLYAFNLAAIPDARQRRAMALAVDRREIADLVLETDVLPATRFSQATARLPRGEPPSPWLGEEGDLEAARATLEEAASVKRRVTLLHVEGGANADVAAAVAAAWRDLGLEVTVRARPAEDYLDFSGPLSAESVDAYQLLPEYRAPEAVSALATWTCGHPLNKTNFCDASFDALLADAAREPDLLARTRLYARAEELLSGESGAMPGVPVYWPTWANLEALAVQETFSVDALGRIDLTAVELR